jgi:hypothetical protein
MIGVRVILVVRKDQDDGRRRRVEAEGEYAGNLLEVLGNTGLLRDLIEDASAKLGSDERAERKIVHAWEFEG